MEIEKRNGDLPKEFKSWMDLYRHLQKENLLEEVEVKFIPYTERFADITQHWFTVDYIKARAFDEVIGVIPDKDELHAAKKELYLKTLENPAWLSAWNILDKLMSI